MAGGAGGVGRGGGGGGGGGGAGWSPRYYQAPILPVSRASEQTVGLQALRKNLTRKHNQTGSQDFPKL